MKFLLVAIFLFSGIQAHAFSTMTIEPARPFDPVILENAEEDLTKVFLGALEGYPDMVEFSVYSTTTVAIQLWQRPNDGDLPLGFIAVRVNENGSGVTEVARAHQQSVTWRDEQISSLGHTLRTSDPVTIDLSAGIYRVEVSAPRNEGVYALRFATESAGYFESLSSSYQTIRHFSYSPLSIIQSPYVYYPIGILAVLIGMVLTWRYRSRFTHAS